MPPCNGAGNPPRLGAAADQSPVQAHPALGDHERFSRCDPFVEWFVQCRAFPGEKIGPHLDAGASQKLDTASRMDWIYINRSNDHLPHT
jgi:hypothetical protein